MMEKKLNFKNMQKIFVSPHWPKRPIAVKINNEDGYISFNFPEEEDREFYSFQINEWIDDYNKKHPGRDWISHMEGKVWFTSDIRKFINKNLGLEDSNKKLEQDEWTEKDEQLSQIAKDNGGFVSLKDVTKVYGDNYLRDGDDYKNK